MKSLFNKIRNYLFGNEEKEPYPSTDPPEEVYEFFQRMKPRGGYNKLQQMIDIGSRRRI